MERDRETYVETGVYAPSDLSPYSTSSTYSSESHTYYPELDWSAQQEARAIYGLSDKGTFIIRSVHLYSGYPPHPELYHPHAGLWHHHHEEGVNASVTLPPLASTIGLSRCSSAGSTSTGANGKPKRRRVQNASQRKAANIRERKRMFHLNEAFDELRKRLPAFNYEKRLSRIETLRLAITYISFMKDVTDGEDPRNVKLKSYPDENSHHMSLSGVGGSDDLQSDSNDEC